MRHLQNLFLLCAYIALAPPSWAKLNVVATTPDLGAIARAIGGDDIDLTILAKPTEDPHFVDPKPSFIVKLRRADILIEGGAELESGWVGALLDQARNPKLAAGSKGRVAAAAGVQLLEIPSALDRSRGDIHAAGNPHFLVDPLNAKIVGREIAEALGAAEPGGAAQFQQRLKSFNETLEAKVVAWQKKLEPFKGRRVVAYHNSWAYFGKRFGLKIDLFLEPKPGVPPTPSHLADVILKMKSEKVNVVMVDAYVNPRTAETVAARTGASVVRVSQFPGGVPGTDSGYVALLDYLVEAIARALEGRS